MADKETIMQIATAAAAAPSGDNSQPWRFVFREPDTLEFHAISEKDNALLNIDQSGTLFALGAAVENARLEAQALGFAPEIRYGAEGSLVATFVLHTGGTLSETERALWQSIPLRHTNRKAYKKTPFTGDDRKALIEAAGSGADVSLKLVEQAGAMTSISRALTTMEEVALKNKMLHEFFFGGIFWSKERNDSGEHGLYIKTLELPAPAELFFRALRYWPVAKLLSKIGFPKMVAETNAKQNASASALGVLFVDRFDRARYVEAGRVLERIWLAAAARGLSLQIVTGALFLARSLEHDASALFSADERASVQHAYAQIRKDLERDEPFLIFRVGYAEAPSAVSYRRPPVIAYPS